MKKNLIGTICYLLSLVGVLFVIAKVTKNDNDPFNAFLLGFILFILCSAIFGWWLYKNGYTSYMAPTVIGKAGDMTPLTEQERLVFIISSLLVGPIIVFTIVFFLWRNVHAGKIKGTYKLFWIVLPVWMVIQFALQHFFPDLFSV